MSAGAKPVHPQRGSPPGAAARPVTGTGSGDGSRLPYPARGAVDDARAADDERVGRRPR
jgi:hypothetical protein